MKTRVELLKTRVELLTEAEIDEAEKGLRVYVLTTEMCVRQTLMLIMDLLRSDPPKGIRDKAMRLLDAYDWRHGLTQELQEDFGVSEFLRQPHTEQLRQISEAL